jgi:hypothetical protein
MAFIFAPAESRTSAFADPPDAATIKGVFHADASVHITPWQSANGDLRFAFLAAMFIRVWSGIGIDPFLNQFFGGKCLLSK